MRRHHGENNRRIQELERDPLWDVTHADHNDDYPQPEPVNGHIPDYVARSAFGQTLIGETERCNDNSQHAQSQQESFSQRASRSPMVDFELNEYGSCETSRATGFDVGFDVSEPDLNFGFDFGENQNQDKRDGGLLDLF